MKEYFEFGMSKGCFGSCSGWEMSGYGEWGTNDFGSQKVWKIGVGGLALVEKGEHNCM